MRNLRKAPGSAIVAMVTLALLGVPILLLVTGFVACWVPGRRAARVDPLVAPRYE